MEECEFLEEEPTPKKFINYISKVVTKKQNITLKNLNNY